MKNSKLGMDRRRRLSELLPHFVTALAMVLLSVGLFFMYSGERQREFRKNLSMRLEIARDRLEEAFAIELGSAERIASIVARKPSITSSELDAFTAAMLPPDTAIKSLSAAPNAVVAWYYPRNSGRSLLGQKLLADTEKRRAIELAIEKKTLVATGPEKDADGGFTVRGSAAVFTSEKGGERLWGLISSVVDFGTVLRKTGLKIDSDSVSFALSSADSRNSSAGTIFWGKKEALGGKPAVVQIRLPGLLWELSATPAMGWNRTEPADYLILLVGLLSAVAVIMIGIFSRVEDGIKIVDRPDSTMLMESLAREIDNALIPLAADRAGPGYMPSGSISIDKDTGSGAEYGNIAPAIPSPLDGARAKNSFWMLQRLFSEMQETVSLERASAIVSHSEFDIRSMVAELSDFYSGHAKARDIVLQTSVEAVIPPKLYGDPERLHRILFNLLGESFAYTENGEVALSVILEEMGRSGVVLRFIVRDSGSDLDPELIDTLFSAFNSIRGSPEKRFATTGLSMSLAGSLVHLLGGRLEYEPGAGQGLMLRFTLGFATSPQDEPALSPSPPEKPASESPMTATATGGSPAAEAPAPQREQNAFETARGRKTGDADAMPERSAGSQLPRSGGSGDVQGVPPRPTMPVANPSAGNVATSPGSGRLPSPAQAGGDQEIPFKPRILLAEDGEVNRDIIMRMLKSRSFSADIATDGRQALAACLRNEYDIVFMDCMMPVMDGYESSSRMRQLKGPGRPVIIGMTASVMESDRGRCFASGMDEVIAKPFTLDELVATIKKHSEPD